MQFKVSEEFVREAHGAACSTWKQRIEKEFPDLFKTELEVGKWYKQEHFKFNYQGGGKLNYGFINGQWHTGIGNARNNESIPMTNEEITSALIAEAKKWDAEWSGKGGLCMGMNVIFTDGQWAEILPQEKTIITKGKALRIIAKKLKVSPESIEIQ